jgi:NAD(P)-dependent dehydrogenase (short-subunit alcohol dehydrogenase family)
VVLDKYNLTGKVVLITGSTGLLGKMHAIALRDIGASLILTDIDRSKLEAQRSDLLSGSRGADIHALTMDVTSRDNIRQVSKELFASEIKVDVLINNAAIDPKFDDSGSELEFSRLENFSTENWHRQISVGLTGAFLCSQEFGSLMASSGSGGVIVNIASDLSIISPDQRLYRINGIAENMQPVKSVAYPVVKAGLIGLTKYLATYWADKGVRCNALSPGGVFTNHSEEFVKRLENLVPMGRMAKIDDYVGALQFLCSDASSYMNGHNLVVDGGRSIW